MRQAGVIAGPGLVALSDEALAKLAQDHINAKTLARGLRGLGCSVDLASIQSNIVYFDLPAHCTGGAAQFVADLEAKRIYMGTYGTMRVRAVTHHQVTANDVDVVLDTVEKLLTASNAEINN